MKTTKDIILDALILLLILPGAFISLFIPDKWGDWLLKSGVFLIVYSVVCWLLWIGAIWGVYTLSERLLQ